LFSLRTRAARLAILRSRPARLRVLRPARRETTAESSERLADSVVGRPDCGLDRGPSLWRDTGLLLGLGHARLPSAERRFASRGRWGDGQDGRSETRRRRVRAQCATSDRASSDPVSLPASCGRVDEDQVVGWPPRRRPPRLNSLERGSVLYSSALRYATEPAGQPIAFSLRFDPPLLFISLRICRRSEGSRCPVVGR
jgi:hypothetical protein